jgi:ATP-binding cassette subfamily F protein 3
VLSDYDGTLLFVSHDRFFIDSIANKVWAMEDGRLVPYLGNYTDMLRERERHAAAPGPPAASRPGEPHVGETQQESAAPSRNGRNLRRGLDKELRAARKRLEAAERSVGTLEGRLDRINDAINMATVDQDVERLAKLGTEYEAVQQELEGAYAEWSQAGAALDELSTEAAELEARQRA